MLIYNLLVSNNKNFKMKIMLWISIYTYKYICIFIYNHFYSLKDVPFNSTKVRGLLYQIVK